MRRRFLHLVWCAALAAGAMGAASPLSTRVVEAAPSPGCVVDLDGILGWWRGEDSMTSVFGPDLVGAIDHDAGRVGRGFAFDQNSDLRAPSLPAPTTAVTVDAWVRPDPANGLNQALLTRWDFPSTDDAARAYSLVFDPLGALVWSVDDVGARRPDELRVAAPTISDGGFHHVAATWDQGVMAVYVDGALSGSAPSRGGTLNPATTTPFRIGAKSGLGDPFRLRGIVDEPTVWGRALTGAEVAAIHGAGASGKCRVVPKLIASTNSLISRLGESVGVSGSTVVAGAPFSNAATQFAGAVHVYTTANGVTWTQQAVLVAADAAVVDLFGWSVDIDGDTIVVGSYGNNGAGADSGAAYVFTRSGSVWTQQAKLVAGDGAPLDGFGYEVSISGDTIVVGAPSDDDPDLDRGAAYVFTRSGSVWTQQAKLTADDAAQLDNFGASVSIDVDSIAVGSPGDDGVADSNRGAAYVFARTGASWTQQSKLTAPDGGAGEQFGHGVSIDADTVVVGTPFDDDAADDSGSAYVFTRSADVWSQQAKLVAADQEAGDRFGFSVGIDGARIVVGAHWEGVASSQTGAAYVFARSGSSWTQTEKLSADDSEAGDADVGDYFGYSVDIDGRIAVGAPLDDERGTNAGAAYTFGP